MTASKRPHWLADAKIAAGVYLGFTKGQWPIQAFSAELGMAERWAAEQPEERVIIGPVPIPDDAPVLRGKTIPAEVVAVPWGESS